MHRKYVFLFCLALVASASAQSNSAQKPQRILTPAPQKAEAKPAGSTLPSETTVNSFLHEYFGNQPGLTWKIVSIKPAKAPSLAKVDVLMSGPQGQQGLEFYVTPDEKHALVGELIPFGPHPFAAARRELQEKATGPSKGPANSPVTIVEFSDLQCPHCKSAEPTIEKLLAEEPNAHFIWENFPLPSHNWAFKAASYADCVGRENKEAFWKFVKGVFDAQEQITEQNADEKLTSIATAAGANGATAAACAAKPETADRVKQEVELGKAVDVNGTPTLFINGRKIGNVTGAPFDYLKSIVEYDAKQGVATKETTSK